MNNPWSQLKQETDRQPVINQAPPVNNRFKSLINKAFSVVGLVAIVFLLGAGLVKAVPNLSASLAAVIGSFSAVFVPKEEIILSGPDKVVSGEAFTISWQRKNNDTEGLYTFSYECREGVYIRANDQTGKEQVVFCNTPFFIQTINDTSLIKAYAENNADAFDINISFTPNGDDRPEAEAIKTISVIGGNINPEDVTVAKGTSGSQRPGSLPQNPNYSSRPTATPRENTYKFSSSSVITGGYTIDPNGRPDLAVKITSVGILDKKTNSFVATTSFKTSDRVALQFEVANKGTNVSGPFEVQDIFPTSPIYVYTPPTQPSLKPGEKIRYTVGFDRIQYGKNSVIVKADPGNSVYESNENNNQDSVLIDINLDEY